MKSYLKTVLAGKNLANFSFAGSLILHVGAIVAFSSWQLTFEPPEPTQHKVVKIKLLPSSAGQKHPVSTTSRKITHFTAARPHNIHSSSMPNLAVRSPNLSNPIATPTYRVKRTRISPNRQFKPRNKQHLSSSVESFKPRAARAANTSLRSQNTVQSINVRRSPILNTSPSKSSHPQKPVIARGPEQTEMTRYKPQPSPTPTSIVSPAVPQNALPIESTQEEFNRLSPRVASVAQHTTFSTRTSIAAQQVPKDLTSSQKLGFKSAALPRKQPQSSPTGSNGENINLDSVRGQFTGQVRQRIADAKYYPRIARRRGMEGQPVIAFTLTKRGGILETNLIQTSGFRLLDEAALEAVQQAAPYPEIPAELKTETYQFKLPISFILK